ncbi:NAD(P)-dependent glycerol-1-phosphate dehydrogenase [Candidatus Hecatella orcuttiae]|jgi:glycerol-1-phosphate dehydrogenase [NAD(P)+]|uniref:NAD(P)-dependent glycerol-1-phosphate dehydrogenase n=1 Tax=Candidatus Hecatella orcuttiae TaxID=1935119 RepID=UPI003182CCFB
MELPRRVIVGNNLLRLVGEACRSLGFSEKGLVISGPRTRSTAAEAVLDSLSDAGFDVEELIVPEPTVHWVEAAERKIKESKPQVVLGVGGGKIIDVTKLSSAKSQVQFISIPTAASHDGIASPQASLKGLEKPLSVGAQAPMAIIADISVIAGSPYRLTASGCGDIMAKYTAVKDWWLSHQLQNEYYGDYAANLALMSARLVSKNADLIHENSQQGVRIVVEALISCGVAMSIAGSSRPCSGSEHLFSHALNMIAPDRALHGERCGVGTIMMAYLHKLKWKMVRDVLRKVGAPTTAEELHVSPQDVVEALAMAHKIRPQRYTILGEKGLSKDAAHRLAKNTGVI